MGKSYMDTYFENDDTVLAVYDFDYATIIDFRSKLESRKAIAGFVLMPLCWPCVPLIVCCECMSDKPLQYENVKGAVEAQHVALTKDGIRYVVERHKYGGRHVGKVTKTVPLDMVTDCDVKGPAGSSGPFCCMVPNVLHTVRVDTGSGNRQASGRATYELVLVGLKDPDQFQKDVWTLKRSWSQHGGSAGALHNRVLLLDSPNSSTGDPPSTLRMDDRGLDLVDDLAAAAADIGSSLGLGPTSTSTRMMNSLSVFSTTLMTSRGDDPTATTAITTTCCTHRMIALLEEQTNLLKLHTEILQDIKLLQQHK